jgi:DegV family protein with EDD domain
MAIKIITDSTSDLTDAAALEYDISVVPCYINVGDQSFLDGIELTHKQFYEKLPTFSAFPQTASPNQSAFEAAYRNAVAEGATHIISIHPPARLSSVVDTARMAAKSIFPVPVSVFDSGTTSLGMGFLAMAASRAARAGRTVADILNLLVSKAQRTVIFAGLETVEYLRRSGRVTRLESRLATFLRIYPVLRLSQGTLEVERVLTYRRAFERLVEMAEAVAPLEELAIMHTNCLEKAQSLRAKVEHLLPNRKIWMGEATPVLGSHVGPGGIGLVCVRSG